MNVFDYKYIGHVQADLIGMALNVHIPIVGVDARDKRPEFLF